MTRDFCYNQISNNNKPTIKMKKAITLMIAAAAMMLSFASCQKEAINPEGQHTALRTITAEFEANTEDKTTLGDDQKTPQWAVGDKIRILSSASHEDVTLAAGNISDNKITITTTLTGTLYAVYPASATTMTSCTDGTITFTIPETQDGTFASANICVAKGDDKDNLIFSNVTSVLEFKQTAATTGVIGVKVAAANAIAGTLTASFDDNGKAVVTPSSLTSSSVKVNATTAQDIYYLSVAPVATGTVELTYTRTITSSTAKLGSKTLARNKIYGCPTMDGRDYKPQTGTINGHMYVQIGTTKWATENLAITESGNKVFNSLKTPVTGEDVVNGDYFQWAAYEGYCGKSTDADRGLLIYESFTSTMCGDAANEFTFKTVPETTDNKWTFNTATSGKNIGISPYYTTKYIKYTAEAESTLESSDDVASICWGATWRMPVGGVEGEFQKLYDATYWVWDATDKGSYVFEPDASHKGGTRGTSMPSGWKKTDALLFFPAAGNGFNSTFDSVSNYGIYLSCSLYTSNTNNAYNMGTGITSINPQNSNGRSNGRTIRPVSD